MGHTTRHETNTTQHDTAGHDPTSVSCHANTPCRLLGPYTTRDLLSRVVPARPTRLAPARGCREPVTR
jgi:hypothetical protein